MRRRESVTSSPSDPPEELLVFRYTDWADEDEQPPAYWVGEASLWRVIRARKRWMAARREWRAEHGVSREEWPDIETRHGIGVAVDP